MTSTIDQVKIFLSFHQSLEIFAEIVPFTGHHRFLHNATFFSYGTFRRYTTHEAERGLLRPRLFYGSNFVAGTVRSTRVTDTCVC